MINKNPVELLFSTTQNYLLFYIVLARSVAEHLNGRRLRIHVLYTAAFNKIPEQDWHKYKDAFNNTMLDFPGTEIIYHDVTDKLKLFDGQNVGQWGGDVSLTHYIYLLAQNILYTSDRVIYMDGDMICNANLCDVFDMDMTGKLIAMAEHSGGDDLSEKELGPDASNSGFLVLNLKLWRELGTFDDILQFGRNLQKTSFCDQALLYYYFAVNNPDKIMYIDKRYNMFPGANPDIPTAEMKVIHFTSYRDPKPWLHLGDHSWRGSDIWWKYARRTTIYELFVDGIMYNKLKKIDKIFNSKKHHSFWWHLRKMKF